MIAVHSPVDPLEPYWITTDQGAMRVIPLDTLPVWMVFIHKLISQGRAQAYSANKRLVKIDFSTPEAAPWAEKWAFLRDAVSVTVLYRDGRDR